VKIAFIFQCQTPRRIKTMLTQLEKTIALATSITLALLAISLSIDASSEALILTWGIGIAILIALLDVYVFLFHVSRRMVSRYIPVLIRIENASGSNKVYMEVDGRLIKRFKGRQNCVMVKVRGGEREIAFKTKTASELRAIEIIHDLEVKVVAHETFIEVDVGMENADKGEETAERWNRYYRLQLGLYIALNALMVGAILRFISAA